jgi:hypothetical protein
MAYRYTLADDIRHVELFGPECAVETAARYLSAHDLAELRAFIAHKERTHRFKHGRWEQRPERARRTCEHCGLDLPVDARAGTRFHRHCQKADAQERYRRRKAVAEEDSAQAVFPITEVAQRAATGLHAPGATRPEAA